MSDNVKSFDRPQPHKADERESQKPSPLFDDKTSSYDFEIEQQLLGALLVNNALYDGICDFLQASHFYDPLHGKIFHIAARLIANNEPATALTLRAFFELDPLMDKKGGTSYLIELEGAASHLVNSISWAHMIEEHAQRRELIQLAQDVYQRALSHNIDNPPNKQIEQAENALYQIAEYGVYHNGMQSFDQSLKTALDAAHLAYSYSSQGDVAGISTGFSDLDEALGALRSSDLIVIAGRPAMGKTALATNIAFNIARQKQSFERKTSQEQEAFRGKKGAVVGFFSLEMSADQLSMRLLSDRANIPSHFIRQGNIRAEDIERLNIASQELNDLPFYIDHTGAISLPVLAARARRLKREKNLGLLVIDYLQLMTTGHKRGFENRVQEVSEITQGLKALAKDLDIPIIALSQLSRQVENRDDKRPQLSDLRESGAIEQDADIVLFLYREEYYLHRTKPDETSPEFEQWQTDMENIQGKTEVLISKHRHGPTGMVELYFERRFTRFLDAASFQQST